ncbi:MAG: HD domain-containing protein [Wenzhouxiangellaceae bacterium]|nr:HD domain-containing protein [Wenzhouxiangellaceae bacterium]
MSDDVSYDSIPWQPQGSEVMIDPAGLQAGHFVSRLDRPWLSTPFALQGVMLEEQHQIDWMRQHCEWVLVDLLRSRNREVPGYHRIEREPPPQDKADFFGDLADESSSLNLLRRAELDEETVSASIEMHQLLTEQVDDLIERMGRSGRIEPERAREQVAGMADSLERNIAAMIWLTRIKNADRYTAQHCVNVAILAMGLARALDWEREQIECAGLAGLLHDLGKTRLDLAILNKPGRLTTEEYAHVKQHSKFGFEMLRHDSSVHPTVAQAVLEHHERPDGRGYPLGRTRDALMPLGVLVGVVDACDAITTRRPYSAPRSHHRALGILWKGRDRQFDRTMVEALIQFLGWITPGTVVRLSTGQFAIVLRASNQYRLWPLVRLIERRDGSLQVADKLDLAEYNRGRHGDLIRVVEVLPDNTLDLALDEVLRNEVNQPLVGRSPA